MKVKYEGYEVDCYMRNRKIVERQTNGDMVLVDTETDAHFHLNRLGKMIWGCMRRRVCTADIIAACDAVFTDTPPEILERDVVRLMEHLLIRQIILPAGDEEDKVCLTR